MTSTNADEAYAAAIATWRADIEAALRAPEGWLSITGLYWLDEGEQTMGSDPASAVVLPPNAAPALAARLAVRDGAVTILAADPTLMVNGEPPPERSLRGPNDGPADRITIGRLVMHVHEAGGRIGIRVRDPENPNRTAFTGRRWYPLRADYRVTARFEPYATEQPSGVANAEEKWADGILVCMLDGHELRLELWGGPHPMVVFRDATSGVETYGTARFLYPTLGADGSAELDFNKAVAPPCAFTPYATCPLPPPLNYLTIAIRAGELDPGWLEH